MGVGILQLCGLRGGKGGERHPFHTLPEQRFAKQVVKSKYGR